MQLRSYSIPVPPHQRLFGRIVRLLAWRVRNQNYSFGVRTSRQATGGCYCCLSVSRRDTTVCWQRRKTDYRFCQHAAVKEKVRWWMLGCLAKGPATKTSCAGPAAVIGPRARCVSSQKPRRAMQASLNRRMFENCGVLKEKKKNATAKLLLSKKTRTLFKPPVNRDGGLLRGRGGQLRSTLSNRECVVRGSLHPSCPLFCLVGAHRTCWPALVDRREVNAPAGFFFCTPLILIPSSLEHYGIVWISL